MRNPLGNCEYAKIVETIGPTMGGVGLFYLPKWVGYLLVGYFGLIRRRFGC